jgi:hypothetical protein
MKRILIYSAGLALAGAAVAQSYYEDGYDTTEARGGYPPCSATITDRCIQLYEPGVATPANLALNERLGDGTQLAEAAYPEPEAVAYADYDNAAVGGPYEPIEDYPEEAAAYDPAYDRAYGEEYASAWPEESTGYYPPCSISPADDRCIQEYEFGRY